MKRILLIIGIFLGPHVLYPNSTFVIAKKKSAEGHMLSDDTVAQKAAEVVSETNRIIEHANRMQKQAIRSLENYAHNGNFGSKEEKKALQECLAHQKQILDQCTAALISTPGKDIVQQ